VTERDEAQRLAGTGNGGSFAQRLAGTGVNYLLQLASYERRQE